MEVNSFNFKQREYSDLKTEFLAIQNQYKGEIMSRAILHEIDIRYQNLFHHFNLTELQWRLTMNGNTILFTPIRQIDQYAIIGILTKEDYEKSDRD